MRLILFCYFVLFISCSCTGQRKANIVQDVPPYFIERNKINISLPDSLGGSKINGFSVIKIYINSSGVPKDFDIMKMNLINTDGQAVINYFNESATNKAYPSEVLPYLPLLKDYVDQIEIRKNPYIDSTYESEVSFMIRFNNKSFRER